MSYADSIAFCKRQQELWRAEEIGLLSAKLFSKAPLNFSNEPEEQQRYVTGWQRGKDQLQIEAAMTTKEVKPWRDPT